MPHNEVFEKISTTKDPNTDYYQVKFDNYFIIASVFMLLIIVTILFVYRKYAKR